MRLLMAASGEYLDPEFGAGATISAHASVWALFVEMLP
jgi:hypothetical protein